MRRFRLMIGGLLLGAFLGALAVWMGPGGFPKGDPLIAGSRQVCEAILADDAAQWESVGARYFTGTDAATDLLKVAKAQSLLFPKGSALGSVRRSADGASGERRMVAVECRAKTTAGERILTLHWQRDQKGPWQLADLLSSAPEPPATTSLPAAATRPADPKSKPQPQAY